MVLERTLIRQSGGASVAARLRAEHAADAAAASASATEAAADRSRRCAQLIEGGATAAPGADGGDADGQVSGSSGSSSYRLITDEMIGRLLSGKGIQVGNKLKGQGGAATVFKGIFKGEPVLIKVIKNNRQDEVINEKDTLLYLKDIPGVVRHKATFGFLVDSGDISACGACGEDLTTLGKRGRAENNVYCILTEFIEGSDLLEYINEVKRIDLIKIYELVQSVAVFLLQTMALIHDKGFIHGDLKLDNIMVRRGTRWEFVIIDFGFASRQGEPRITRGTTLYLAPEVVNSRTGLDDKSKDLFAIGVTLFTLMFSNYPFPKESFRVGGKPHNPVKQGTNFTAANLKDFSREENTMTKEMYQTLETEQIEETKKEINAKISLLEKKQADLNYMIKELNRHSPHPSALLAQELNVAKMNNDLEFVNERKKQWQTYLQGVERSTPDENLADIIVDLLSYDAVDRGRADKKAKKAKKAKTKEGGGKKKRKRKLKRSYRKFRKKKTKTKTKRKTKRKIK